MSLSDPRLRRAALLVAGAATVHELRFALAPVHGGEGPGHAYLQAALPLVTVLVALAAAGFVARLVAPRRELPARRSLLAEWLGCAVVLFAAFVLQEGAESLSSAHGPIFAAGGWLAAPVALAVGLAVALLARGARAAVAAGVQATAHLRVVLPALPALVLSPSAVRRAADAPLRHLAARPPPGSLVPQHQ
jgi:hypothetical protein